MPIEFGLAILALFGLFFYMSKAHRAGSKFSGDAAPHPSPHPAQQSIDVDKVVKKNACIVDYTTVNERLMKPANHYKECPAYVLKSEIDKFEKFDKENQDFAERLKHVFYLSQLKLALSLK